MKIKLLLFVALLASTFSFAQNAALDIPFGKNGAVRTGFDSYDIGKKIIVQPDGKILIVGLHPDTTILKSSGFVVHRINKNGKFDTTFGKNGTVVVDSDLKDLDPFNIYLQPDGKILVTGTCTTNNQLNENGFIYRFDATGKPDITFGKNGVTVTGTDDTDASLFSLKLQKDGSMYTNGRIAATNDLGVLVEKYDSKGVQDLSFGQNGRFIFELDSVFCIGTSIDQLSNGDLILYCAAIDVNDEISSFILKITEKGVLDKTFGKAGIIKIDEVDTDDLPYYLIVQSDDKIIALSQLKNKVTTAMYRFDTSGKSDLTFGKAGRVEIGSDSVEFYSTNFSLTPDNKYVIVGSSINDIGQTTGAITMLKNNGKVDKSFGNQGRVDITFNDEETYFLTSAIQADGKILVDGVFNTGIEVSSAVFRIDPSKNVPTVDLFQAAENILLSPNPVAEQTSLTFNLSNTENVNIQLIDIQGKTIHVFVNNENMSAGKQQVTLNMPASIVAGVYFVQLNTENGSSVTKLVKQ